MVCVFIPILPPIMALWLGTWTQRISGPKSSGPWGKVALAYLARTMVGWLLHGALMLCLVFSKNPAPIRLVFHDLPWAILAFTQKTIRGKNDNVEPWFCEWSVSRLLKSNIFHFSVVLQLFSFFWFLHFIVRCHNGAPTNACQILHKEGAW